MGDGLLRARRNLTNFAPQILCFAYLARPAGDGRPFLIAARDARPFPGRAP